MNKIVPIKSPIQGQYWFEYIIDGKKGGLFVGYWENDEGGIFHLNGIKIENKYRGKGLGEQLMIDFLKTYGGKIHSNSSTRSESSQKMWDRIIRRNDVIVEVTPYFNNILKKRFDHYLLSLK